MGCQGSGFFALFSGQPAQCGPLNNQIQQLRANLDRLLSELQRVQGNSGDREGQRRSILVALGQNDCGPQYRQYANAAPGGFFENLFGGNPRAGAIRSPAGDLPHGVRAHLRRLLLPDFLLHGAEKFAEDERLCQRLCPATEATLTPTAIRRGRVARGVDERRQAVEHGGHDQPAHPVGCIGHHLERPEGGDVDEGPNVVGEGSEQVKGLEPAGGAVGGRHARARHRLDLGQAAVLADGSGAGQAELHAVVLRRVVGSREHRTRRIELARREVHEVRGGEAEVDHVDALRAHAVAERGGQLHARGPHVTTHQHPPGPADLAGHEHGEGLSHRASHAGIELLGVMPRMSYALKIASRSAMAGQPYEVGATSVGTAAPVGSS